MDLLEHDLRRVLRDERWALDPAPDAAARVHRGVRRRRRRQSALTVAAAASAVLVVVGVAAAVDPSDRDAAPVPAASPSPRVAAYDVPWLDAPVSQRPAAPPEPTRPLASPRPTTVACAGSQLRGSAGMGGGATGHLETALAVRNVGAAPCTLDGFPTLTALDAAGRRVVVKAEHGTWFDAQESRERPATIDPGESAHLSVETSMACEGGAPSTVRRYRSPQVLLGDGTAFDVGAGLESSCPLRISSWFRLVTPPPPHQDPWEQVTARADLPDTVRAGSTLEYVVTLTNTGDEDFALSPCPSYAESIGATETYYRLNCTTLSSLPAHAEVRFEMRVPVPDTLAGPVKLLWRLGGTTVSAGGMVTVS